MDLLPLWLIFPVTVLIAFLSVDAGIRLARYRRSRSGDNPEAPPAGMVGATLGLLAFMSAFTFGMATTRFEARRQLVLTEANAIGTAYLRAALLPEPTRTNARTILKQYVETRLAGTNREQITQSITKSEELQKRLWIETAALAEKERTAITSLFIQSVNQLVELHEQRLTATLRSRVPTMIWAVLYLLLILAMAAVGYQEALASKRRSIAVVMLVLGFSAVLFLIADLDRPGQGWFEVNQESMMNVKRRMMEQ